MSVSSQLAETVGLWDRQGLLGTITARGGVLTGSSPGMQKIADSALRLAGGDVAAAWQQVSRYSNGYIQARAMG